MKMNKTFSASCRRHINAIHRLSLRLNKLRGKAHPEVLLGLIAEHAREIKYLYNEKENHYIIETGDLLVLCLELFKEAKVNSDEVMEKCYRRYYRKLSSLLEAESGGSRKGRKRRSKA